MPYPGPRSSTTAVADGPRRGPAAAIAVVAFLTTADGTIVNVALPSIQRDLGMSLPSAQWVVTAYLVAFSAFMLAGGRLTDRYGTRTALRLGLGAFTAASVVAGMARTAAVLLLARGAQGAGAALALPAGLAMAASGPTARDRDALAAVWMASLASALALGPVLGGWISQHLGWNWIFLVNLPAGLAGLVVTRFTAADPPRDERARAGWPRLACSVIALAAVTFVLTDGDAAGWTSARIVAAAAVASVCAAGLAYAGWRSRTPVTGSSRLSGRMFGGIAVSVLWGAGVNGVFFCTSILLQRDAGFSATRTGLVFLPAALLVILVTAFIPALTARLGAARTVAAGLLVVAAGLALLAMAVRLVSARHLGIAALLPPAAVIGAGSALTTPLTPSVLASVPPDRVGAASGVLSLAREASGLAGICLITLIVTAAGAGADGNGGAFAHGYGWGVLAAAALTVAGAVIAWLTLPGKEAGSVSPRG